MNENKLTVITRDKKKLILDIRIRQASSVLENASLMEEIDLNMIDSKIFEIIYNFYKKFDFQIPILKKMIPCYDLKDGVDSEIYKFFEEYLNEEKIIDLDKIKPIIDGCYFYDFKELKDYCLNAIGSAFCFQPPTSSLKKFETRWKISSKKITTTDKLDLITEYETIFKSLLENYLSE